MTTITATIILIPIITYFGTPSVDQDLRSVSLAELKSQRFADAEKAPVGRGSPWHLLGFFPNPEGAKYLTIGYVGFLY